MSAPAVHPTTLQLATALRDRGWRPFPVDHPSLPQCAGTAPKCREGNCAPEKRGKHPVGGWGTMTASAPTDQMLALWFGGEPRNIGIGAGPSGLLVLDEDDRDALELLADQLGERMPDTYRVLTSRGWHYYLADPANEFGNSAGALADIGVDVRGGHGHGGYVVAAGSLHHTGVHYTAADDHADTAPIPEWIKAQIRTPATAKTSPAGTAAAGPAPDGGWTDTPRPGYPDELRGQYRRHLDSVRSRSGQFRHELFLAALDGWRLVDVGLLDEFTMLNQIKDAIMRVWGNPPNDDDRAIVYTEARAKATTSPWVVTDPTGSPSATSALDGATGSAAQDDDATAAIMAEAAERILAGKVAEELERRKVRRLADEAERPPRPPIRDGLLDISQLATMPAPQMLVSAVIPEEAVGYLGGRSGAYKTFVAVALGCALARGKAPAGFPDFVPRRQVRVLYVAAEGPRGVASRVRADMAVNGPIEDGALLIYPRPIDLTDPFAVADLEAVVVERQVGFVIVDTFGRSSGAANDNDTGETRVVFNALASLRDLHGVGGMFLDHTGHAGERLRGASGKGDDGDFVLMLSYRGDSRASDVQRTLSVAKLKDEESDASWPIRLQAILVDGRSVGVAQLGEVGGGDDSPFGGLHAAWWEHDALELPDTVRKLSGPGSDAAREIFRVLRYVGEEMTMPSLLRAINERPGGKSYSEPTARRGRVALENAGVVAAGSTATRHTLTTPYWTQ